MPSQNELSPLGPAEDQERPFFACGVFKPTELGYARLSDVVREHRAAAISGSLLIRDGFAVYDSAGRGIVRGFTLWFDEGRAAEAYHRICEFEPRRLYKWVQTTTADGVAVNVVAGRGSIPGAVPHEHEDWLLWRDDAMFRDGLSLVLEGRARYADFTFPSAPPDQFPWDRFFELQMLHMFAWTLLERYVAMRLGPRVSSTQSAQRLGEDELFAIALSETGVAIDRPLYDTRGSSPYRFDANDPTASATYLYQLRSNVVHRGKGAHQDAELLRLGLLVLADVLQQVRTRSQASE